MLLAVPNVSEGRDRATIERLAGAFGALRLLDVHSDPDHGRSVLSFAGEQAEIAEGLLAGAREAIAAIDLSRHEGLHPHVGAIDVASGRPPRRRHARRRDRGGAHRGRADRRRARAAGVPLRRAGRAAASAPTSAPAGSRRWPRGCRPASWSPDYGPAEPHPTAGAVLVTARPPLAAFNVDLDTDDVELARAIAAELRESGGGPAGVRAIGLYLPARGRAQVSFNVHDPVAVPLAELVARVRERAPVAEAELVGLAPRAAFAGFPDDVPLRGFDPERHLIEEALASLELMAQTKRKRKHRGTAAGTIESRGRTGRPPTSSEIKKTAAQRRQDRLDKPPTWRGAMNRAAIAAVGLRRDRHARPRPAAGRRRGARNLRVRDLRASGYYMDKWLYQRRQRQGQQQKQR